MSLEILYPHVFCVSYTLDCPDTGYIGSPVMIGTVGYPPPDPQRPLAGLLPPVVSNEYISITCHLDILAHVDFG